MMLQVILPLSCFVQDSVWNSFQNSEPAADDRSENDLPAAYWRDEDQSSSSFYDSQSERDLSETSDPKLPQTPPRGTDGLKSASTPADRKSQLSDALREHIARSHVEQTVESIIGKIRAKLTSQLRDSVLPFEVSLSYWVPSIICQSWLRWIA